MRSIVSCHIVCNYCVPVVISQEQQFIYIYMEDAWERRADERRSDTREKRMNLEKKRERKNNQLYQSIRNFKYHQKSVYIDYWLVFVLMKFPFMCLRKFAKRQR